MKCTRTSVKKKYCWIWIAVDREKKRFIECVLGSRDTETGQKLWDCVGYLVKGKVMSDYWKAYSCFIPKEQHIQSKAHTYTVEGYNSLFRHFLARLKRKTKCYSKCQIMLQHSVRLLMAHRNQLKTFLK